MVHKSFALHKRFNGFLQVRTGGEGVTGSGRVFPEHNCINNTADHSVNLGSDLVAYNSK
jgi:hypothetical protein